jgi:tetratricopeptide (TPR) repeat protein
MAYAHLAKSQALMALDQPDGALAAADHAIKLGPQLADAHKVRAAVLDALGRGEEAKESRERAKALAPEG